ncbi:hypothetical protein ACLOJK_020472 [Asimina triloba]
MAYSSADISGGGSGCFMWGGDLVDMQVYGGGGQDIYIRAVASELGHETREIQPQIFSDENDLEDSKEAPDLPLFELNVIAAATNNFSSENKLGEGGFGPVYKVMLGLPLTNRGMIN